MSKPLLSIIIVTYNTKDITLNCLKSIETDKGLKDIPYEIIVVDNNSTDGTIPLLTTSLLTTHLVKNSSNLGFAKANNQAIKIAQGNYLLFLNSDTIILHSAISQSLNWLSSHPEAHGCTAQLLNKDRSIQPSGGYFPNLANVFTWSLGLDDLPFVNKIIKPFHPHPPQFYLREKYYKTDHPQDWLTGAFFLVRASIVKKTHGFDENFFMYGEEMEWQYRIKQALPHSQLWYLIGPQIVHLGGASAKRKSDPILREYQGVLAFFKKHKPKYQYKLVRNMLKINAALRSLIIPGYQKLCSKI